MTELQDIDFVELSDEEMHLYSRQILLDGWDIEAQEKLKLANVLIVGAGGIGCSSAELLARAGVGKITLIDADTIEISNLQRQIAFGHEDIGSYKAEVLAKRLQKINPYICVEYYNERLDEHNIDRLVEHQDVVLDGCDNFTTRYLVNAACKKYQVALISASAIGFQAQMFMVEGDSACYECLFPKERHSNEGLRCAESGVLATTPVMIASLQAHHTLLYLGLNLTPLKQKLLLWDGLNMTQRIVNFDKDINCPVCQAS
ncbi:HesA/MoeB/ThiF family protein [Acinetobacter sp. V91_7]|uniref:HesA/MoeB/ThiF family protein n=1 Tax=unclassified Acinetobacter TaxID=196816 RepID=UPI00287D23BB|nr:MULTISPECIES: HesA/MoeB/ThiF family protein [unclassified Acinetobacter]MDS7934905.1 HesA/MoeB/ThiF family protein [Acinetobacter sp. V91_4B]MDS7963093.1 HesA/MoeB/ThiF family protein [Acinetobacter sp. V91_7]MDS8026710.1 HesA/MoeB/ThiF family protein [Acinetobacter sp. V91_13]